MKHTLSRTLALLGLAVLPASAVAADHIEAPLASADPAADIADFYAWPTDDGKIVSIITVAGAGTSADEALYDEDILYGFHIDNTRDAVADIDVWVRFGQDSAGEWGMQVSGLPGGDDVVVGPVGTVLDAGGGLRVWAGHADDPFFFDLEGFQNTLSTGTVSFDPERDFFAGLNVTGIVIEMSAGAVVDKDHNMSIWTTTSRK